MKKIFILFFCCTVSIFAVSQPVWQIDAAKSSIKFTINGPFSINVDGTMGSLKGAIVFDVLKLESSSFTVSIDANTVFTDNHKRDEHLKKPEFFDVSKYKVINFSSTSIEKTGNGFIVSGNLSMKDKVLPVKIPFTFTKSGRVGRWRGEFKLNRLDYHVGTSSLMMGDDVKIVIDVSAVDTNGVK